MSLYVTINDGELINLDAVRRIRPLTDEDRASLAQLGNNVEADKYNSRVELANRRQRLAEETVDEIAAKGVSLVQIDDESFVPRKNIISARNLTDEDRQAFERSTGREMSADLKSQVETSGGTVLAKYDAEEVMSRIGRPYQPATAMPGDAETPSASEQRQAMLDRSNQQQTSLAKSNSQDRNHGQVPTQ